MWLLRCGSPCLLELFLQRPEIGRILGPHSSSELIFFPKFGELSRGRNSGKPCFCLKWLPTRQPELFDGCLVIGCHVVSWKALSAAFNGAGWLARRAVPPRPFATDPIVSIR